MSFGIGINAQETDAGEVKGSQKDIAVKVWFTSKGDITPLTIKLQDEYGEIHTIDKIQVHTKEKKNYAGTPSIEFDCTINVMSFNQRVHLIYYQSENRWVLNYH